jgi:hypothetical protein
MYDFFVFRIIINTIVNNLLGLKIKTIKQLVSYILFLAYKVYIWLSINIEITILSS